MIKREGIRLVRYLIISILIVLTTGCSRIELAYRNADWFLESYARKAVAAKPDQIEQWQPVLHGVLERHRVELLPLLIAYLDLLARASQRPDEGMLADCLMDAGFTLYERHAQLAVELAVPMLIMLDASQINHLAEYTARDQEKARKLYLNRSLEEQHKARLARIIQRTENWLGDLNDSQLQEMEQALSKMPDLSEHWLDYRAKQTTGLLLMLRSHPQEQSVRQYLSNWWISFEQRSVEYDQEWTIAKQEFIHLLQRLGRSLTERQHARLKREITSLRKVLASLQEPFLQPENLPELLSCSSST